MFRSINAIEFNRKFSTHEDCYTYLINLKWGNGYSCSRCGCTKSVKGRLYYYRRCQQCKYDESVTANTVFHGMKIPILKAFHIVFRLSAKKKGMSTVELGCEVGVQQKTAWLLKRKIQVVMKQHNTKDVLKGKVDVDETMLGFHTGREHGGRNLEKREAVLVGVEVLEDGRTGSIRLKQIENFEALTLKYGIKDMTSPEAKIRTDNYVSYRTIQNDMSNLTIEASEQGKAFEELHRQIMQLKNWIVGIHHKWSKKHLYAYLDEYVYRFNQRNSRASIFDSVIRGLMHQVPHPYSKLMGLCEYST